MLLTLRKVSANRHPSKYCVADNYYWVGSSTPSDCIQKASLRVV